MNYLNVNASKVNLKFDWDNLDVGNNQLDHSQKFFARKHYEHERLEELKKIELLNIEMASTGIKDDGSPQNKENEEPEEVNGPETEVPASIAAATTPVQAESLPQPATASDTTLKPTKKPLNVACAWSTQKRVVTKKASPAASGNAKPAPPTPHAYQCATRYQRNREEALRKIREEEKKKREFHSRPAPKFQSAVVQKPKNLRMHYVTIPETPQVLRNSREAEAKRRQKMEELRRQQAPPKFHSRPPTVLKEQPFMPEKAPTQLEQRPFKLSMEERLQQRKQFDEATRRAIEEKKKQEEEEKKIREEEYIRELRKITTFKAQPNPFK